jgi:hypothetical protein
MMKLKKQLRGLRVAEAEVPGRAAAEAAMRSLASRGRDRDRDHAPAKHGSGILRSALARPGRDTPRPPSPRRRRRSSRGRRRRKYDSGESSSDDSDYESDRRSRRRGDGGYRDGDRVAAKILRKIEKMGTERSRLTSGSNRSPTTGPATRPDALPRPSMPSSRRESPLTSSEWKSWCVLCLESSRRIPRRIRSSWNNGNGSHRSPFWTATWSRFCTGMSNASSSSRRRGPLFPPPIPALLPAAAGPGINGGTGAGSGNFSFAAGPDAETEFVPLPTPPAACSACRR